MVFSSLSFLFLFLPITLLFYIIMPNIKAKNGLLVVVSLLFYAWGEPVYVLLLLASVLVNYIIALLIEKYEKQAKLYVTISVVLNLSMLAVFKYAGFLTESVNGVFGISLPVPQISLPIGISFFTFQILSYVLDVYRKDTPAQKSFGKILLYISFFPQLIAGPIVKYHDINLQLSDREMSLSKMADGFVRFIVGLSKKVIISNVAALVADYVFALPQGNITTLGAWSGAVCYMLQIYFDFSGYSDMAIGLGKIFGFEFKENFNYPYIAFGIKDFWRRWHISLSTWFKEYLYIPLGGNRKGKARTYINQFIVFAATGIWHGANVTFLLWGLIHGILLTLESAKIIPPDKAKKHLITRIIFHIYTLLAILLSFVLFRADTVRDAGVVIARMFGIGAQAYSNAGILTYFTPYFIFMLCVGVIGSTPIVPFIKKKIIDIGVKENVVNAVSFVICVLLFVFCTLLLTSDTYNPFIYFRF